FRAGQASVPRPGWLWPGATATFALLSVVLGGTLLFRPVSVHERIVVRDHPAADGLPRDFGSDRVAGTDVESRRESPEDLRMRRLVLRGGVEALPGLTAAPDQAEGRSPTPPDTRDLPSRLGIRTFTPSGGPL